PGGQRRGCRAFGKLRLFVVGALARFAVGAERLHHASTGSGPPNAVKRVAFGLAVDRGEDSATMFDAFGESISIILFCLVLQTVIRSTASLTVEFKNSSPDSSKFHSLDSSAWSIKT